MVLDIRTSHQDHKATTINIQQAAIWIIHHLLKLMELVQDMDIVMLITVKMVVIFQAMAILIRVATHQRLTLMLEDTRRMIIKEQHRTMMLVAHHWHRQLV